MCLCPLGPWRTQAPLRGIAVGWLCSAPLPSLTGQRNPSPPCYSLYHLSRSVRILQTLPHDEPHVVLFRDLAVEGVGARPVVYAAWSMTRRRCGRGQRVCCARGGVMTQGLSCREPGRAGPVRADSKAAREGPSSRPNRHLPPSRSPSPPPANPIHIRSVALRPRQHDGTSLLTLASVCSLLTRRPRSPSPISRSPSLPSPSSYPSSSYVCLDLRPRRSRRRRDAHACRCRQGPVGRPQGRRPPGRPVVHQQRPAPDEHPWSVPPLALLVCHLVRLLLRLTIPPALTDKELEKNAFARDFEARTKVPQTTAFIVLATTCVPPPPPMSPSPRPRQNRTDPFLFFPPAASSSRSTSTSSTSRRR